MHTLEDLELGVLEWANGSADETLTRLKGFGVRCGQLGIPGAYPLREHSPEWKAALKSADFHIETVVCSFLGEDYSDVAKVIDTVGLVPPATRSERIQRLKELSDFAADIGIENLACHIGFVPENKSNPAYGELVAVVADICDHCSKLHQYFALETGQEPAHVLLEFIRDVDRESLKVNFDPANMILYGTGNPIDALDVLGKQVISVHAKDGDWPAMDKPNLLGQERALGHGSVDIEAFVSKLKEIGYRGLIFVEREDPDEETRRRDIRHALTLLKKLTGRKLAVG